MADEPLTGPAAGKLTDAVDALRKEEEAQRRQAQAEGPEAPVTKAADRLAERINTSLATPAARRAAAPAPPLSAAQRLELEQRFPGMAETIQRRSGTLALAAVAPPRAAPEGPAAAPAPAHRHRAPPRASAGRRPSAPPKLELPEPRSRQPRYVAGAALLSSQGRQPKGPRRGAADIAARFGQAAAGQGQGQGEGLAAKLPVDGNALRVSVVRSIALQTAERNTDVRLRPGAKEEGGGGLGGLLGLIRSNPAIAAALAGLGYANRFAANASSLAGSASPTARVTREGSEELLRAAAGARFIGAENEGSRGRQITAAVLNQAPPGAMKTVASGLLAAPGVDTALDLSGFHQRIAAVPGLRSRVPFRRDLGPEVAPSRMSGFAQFGEQVQTNSMNVGPLSRELQTQQRANTFGDPETKATLKAIEEGIRKLNDKPAAVPAWR